MKLYTKNAMLGRFFLVKFDTNGERSAMTTSVAPGGFDKYEDAEAALQRVGVKSGEVYLIVQVSGEFKTKAQIVEVHPA